MADGVVITTIGAADSGTEIAVQTDGKIVVAGTSDGKFALVRYNFDGTLDTGFGIGGKVTTAVGGTNVLSGIALQGDGKIIVGGTSDDDFALARYNQDGSLDISFDGDGLLKTNIGGRDALNDLALQSNGKIVAVGTNGSQNTITRYNANGSLDQSFGTGGVSITQLEVDYASTASAVTITSDDQIVVTGQQRFTGGLPVSNIYVAKFNSNGSLNTSFDNDGVVTIRSDTSDSIVDDVVIDAQGRPVVSGFSNVRNGGLSYIQRFGVDGQLDGSAFFDRNFVGQHSEGGLVLLPDQSAVTVGAQRVHKFSVNLIIDPNFGTNGLYLLPFTGYDITALSNGQMLIAGTFANDFALVKLNTNGTLDTSFGIVAPQNIIEGTDGPDTLVGTAEADEIRGLGSNDSLSGLAGNDFLFGGLGDDTLNGGLGDDMLNGGDGIDTASYADSAQSVTVDLSQNNTVIATGGAGKDKLISIENVIGGLAGDTLIGDANANMLSGMQGDDRLLGGAGNDVLIGGSGAQDILNGGGGADVLDGRGSYAYAEYSLAASGVAAYLTWPAGNSGEAAGDTYLNIRGLIGSPFADVLSGDAQENTILGGEGGDWLFGLEGSDYLLGGAASDVIEGGAGNDLLDGGVGNDVLKGGDGFDTFVYQSLSDSSGASYDIITDFQRGVDKIDLTAIAPNYISIIHANGASFLFPATPSGGTMLIAVAGDVEGPDIIGAPNLFIVGDSIADTLIGGAGSDTIIGNDGNDVIIGGGSGDALSGNGGADTFRFLSASESNPQALDIIQDFVSGTDIIDLAALAPTNISVLTLNSGVLVSGIASNGGIFQFATTTAITGTDILGLTGGLYMQGDGAANTLTGSVLADNIYGGDGNDIIIGGLGADALFGQGGADTFRYLTASQSSPSGFDIIQDFQTGTDKLDLSALGITGVSITRTAGGTFVTGAAPSGVFQVASTRDINPGDIVGLTTGANFTGSDGNDILIGSGFSETINAGAGNDIVIGGGAADALFGGAGADIFRYLNRSDSTPAAADIIQDFQTGVDKVDLTAVRTGGSDSFALLRDASASYLFFDLGGDGTNDIQILFTNPNVQTSDLML